MRSARYPVRSACSGVNAVQETTPPATGCSQLADPPMTKDAVAGRIRRLLAMADKRAKELGVPDTESAVTRELLEETL